MILVIVYLMDLPLKQLQKQIICCRNIVHFVLLRKISESMLQAIVHLQPEHP